jgi:pimeloyl-ACP methyl ester carboxylesterase
MANSGELLKEDITLVCDAGMGNWSVFFKPLAQELSGLMPIFLVDRPGYTSKLLPSTKRLCETAATDIKDILAANGITGNIVLAGHSLGGLNMRMYYENFPEKVRGLILIDAAHPMLLEVIPEVKQNIQLQIIQVNKLIKMARWGLLKLAKKRIPTFGLPEELHKEYYRITTSSRYYQLYKMEMEVFDENLQQCKDLGFLEALPLLVISSKMGLNTPINGKEKETALLKTKWHALQRNNASLSTNSSYHEIDGGHFLHVTEVKMVAKLIKEFITRLS